MPIGVPRIIYCWGEELPPQWTDIYNFIFRRRMVFLMQYLDNELCNQICGLLINIHMEDRSKELEKKEVEKSGIFQSSGQNAKAGVSPPGGLTPANPPSGGAQSSQKQKKNKSMEDLLSSYSNSSYEEDLAIDENYTLEQYTLQKITLEWLNWNAQFFDYSDEPYLFYLAEILSKDFSEDDTQLFYPSQPTSNNLGSSIAGSASLHRAHKNTPHKGVDVYSPFRSIVNVANLIAKDKNFSIKNLLPAGLLQNPNSDGALSGPSPNLQQNPGLAKLMGVLASKNLVRSGANKTAPQNQLIVPNKALGQRNLRKEYAIDNVFSSGNGLRNTAAVKSLNPLRGIKRPANKKALGYLDFDSTNSSTTLFADVQNRHEYARKQTQKALQEEESKKVFVIINSFGGSVGNGITVHDALQFIKAGSLTLGLGVAASAASLVLAGGTISERYVTEGCHVMIHQPDSACNGQASDIWIDSQEIMKIRLDVAEIYSLSAHRPRHKILKDLDRDFYLTAIETIHYGLADEIATNEVMHDIIEMTNKVWSIHNLGQQKLLETRDRQLSGTPETNVQN